MQDAMQYFPHTELVVVGMGLFIFAFTGLLFVVLNKSQTKLYQDMSQLPLGQEGSHE